MKKIVLIDDEYLSRESLKDCLAWNYYGYEICGEAANGQAGLSQIIMKKPDVIFLDIKMPVMDGLQLLKQLQEDAVRSKVIMLSCYDDFEYVREAMRLGAVDYLLKHTYEEEDLIHILRKLDQIFLKEEVLSKGLDSLRQETFQKIVMGKTPAADYASLVSADVLPAIPSSYMTSCLQLTGSLPESLDLFSLFNTLFASFKKENPEKSLYFHDIFVLCATGTFSYLLFLFSKQTSAAKQKACVKDFLGYVYPLITNDHLDWHAGFCYHSYTRWDDLREACLEAKEMLSDELPYQECSAKVMSAISYIKANYKNPLSLEEIAEHAGISRIYLSQLFKKETKTNVSDYLLRYRLTKAKELLLNSNLKVYQIAELCGFGTAQYFCLLFKKAAGISPYQFRDCHASGLEI